jgi:hypothetical protein
MAKKKGHESNCQFDSKPLKVWNHLDFLTCRWRVTSCWKKFRWGLQLYFRLHINQRSAHKVMGLQSRGSPSFGNFMTPIWEVPRQNDIWMFGPWQGTENTIRGKVVASPKFELWWVLWVRVCSWLVRAPKLLQLRINQLVIWFV